ncbi:MAG: hypothetical protein AB9866_06425 [Syntrophobacteraceae bacterium]
MEDFKSMELSFFGKMTAGFTHEVKNVLAIIKENAGLMEDILFMAKGGSLPNIERLSRAIASIREQADRGVELSNRLNRFAHSADYPRVRVDLNTLLDQLSLLAQRFARLKEVTLEVALADQPIQVETCPVCLQMALFTGLECCWNAMPSGGCVSLHVMKRGGDAAIGFSCRSSPVSGLEFMDAISPSQDWAKLNETVKILGAGLETGQPGYHFTIVLPPNG